MKIKCDRGKRIVLNNINGLYTLLKQDIDEVTIKLSTEDHPIFKAHFPNNPILPGFALVDIIAKSLNESIISIQYSKFIAHIKPNDILLCTIKTQEKKRTIKVFKNKQKVSEITYESK